AAEHRKLELHDEIFEQAGIDELGVFRTGDPDIGPGQDVVDGLGEEKAADEGDAEGQERLDQARAQLDQVLHQRRLGRLDLLLLVLAAHAALPPASPLLGSATASAGAGGEATGGAGLGAVSAPAWASLAAGLAGAAGCSAGATGAAAGGGASSVIARST